MPIDSSPRIVDRGKVVEITATSITRIIIFHILFLCSVFEIHIVLFSRKLITITFKRISQHSAGKICIRAITFPIKE